MYGCVRLSIRACVNVCESVFARLCVGVCVCVSQICRCGECGAQHLRQECKLLPPHLPQDGAAGFQVPPIVLGYPWDQHRRMDGDWRRGVFGMGSDASKGQ